MACPHWAWAQWLRHPPSAAGLTFFGVRRLHIDAGRGARATVIVDECRWEANWTIGRDFANAKSYPEEFPRGNSSATDALDGGLCCVLTVIECVAEAREN